MRVVFVFVAVSALMAQQPVPAVSSPWFQGTNGLVTHSGPSDCAVDGVVVNGTTGEPIPRAQVMLIGQGQSATRADNSGQWSFRNVACGVFRVTASRPGFLGGNNARGFYPLTLTSGAAVHDVKIALTPQSVVTGKVVDDQGDPVQNAQVTALISRITQGRRIFQQTAVISSNDLGEFRLSGLEAGRYIFCARSVMMQLTIDDSTVPGDSCYPGPVEGGNSSAMDLDKGREMHLDFTLTRVPAVHIRGSITGMPKNANVAIALMKPHEAGGRGLVPQTTTIMRTDGIFDIAGVPAGSWFLNSDYFDGGKRYTARVPIQVGASDIDGMVVPLQEGLSVSGTVRFESTSGRELPPQFNIALRSSEPMMGAGSARWNKEHNSFTIPEITPGAYRLDVFIPAPFYVKSAMLGGRDLSREDVQLSESAGPVDVVLSDDSGAIEGQAVGADGQPAASAAILILPRGRTPLVLTADAAGKFKSTGRAPGDYEIFAFNDAQDVEYANPDWLRHYTGAKLTVEPGQTASATVTAQIVSAR